MISKRLCHAYALLLWMRLDHHDNNHPLRINICTCQVTSRVIPLTIKVNQEVFDRKWLMTLNHVMELKL